MPNKAHWEHVYSTKAAGDVSWFQEHAALSIELIKATRVARTSQIIDVGGGVSTLVADLLAEGYACVTVLDISGAALRRSQDDLGPLAVKVTWLEADITQAELAPNFYDVWHDRAVFHFLTDAKERAAYIAAVKRSVKMGGHIIVASFGLTGPERCSGLKAMRYSPESLHSEFGEDFRLLSSVTETHHTPSGKEQAFIYCYCRKGPE